MSGRIGVEIAPGVLRAVRIDGWLRPRYRSVEVAWSPDDFAGAVNAVREFLGSASRVAVAVDLAFLRAKHVKLPPVPLSEKRRILGLEPERFFPVRDEALVLSVLDHDDLVFAARASQVEEWIGHLEALGRVDAVEPAPVALARSAGRGGRMVIVTPDAEGRVGVLELEGGRIRRVRRVGANSPEILDAAGVNGTGPPTLYTTASDPAALVRDVTLPPLEPLPASGALAARDLTALGAAMGVGGDLEQAMVSPPAAARIRTRRRRDVALAVVVLAAAVLFVGWSADHSRRRTLENLAATAMTLRDRASGIQELQARTTAMADEIAAVAKVATDRADPVNALAALTELLPDDAWLLSIQVNDADWQVNGLARSAAPIVPALSSDPRFHDVRFLSATSRVLTENGPRESFSLAFRFVPVP